MKQPEPERKNPALHYRWLVLAILCACCFFVYFHRAAVNVMRDALAETFLLNASAFSLLSMMYLYPYIAMQVPTGILADRIGVKRTLALGCIVASAGSAVFFTAQNFFMSCVGRALIGAGVSGPIVCLQKNVTQWFSEKQRGRVSAIGSLSGTLGGVFSQAPLALLLSCMDWRNVYMILGAVSLLLAVLCGLFVCNNPAEKGWPLIAEDAPQRPVSAVRFLPTLKDIFRNRSMLILAVGFIITMGNYTAFGGTWAVTYIQNVFDMTLIEASGYSTILLTGMAIGSISGGFLSDRIQSRKIPLCVLGGVGVIGWFFLIFQGQWVYASGLLGMDMFLIGLAMSAISLSFSVIREYADPAAVGTTVGIVNAAALLIGSLFPTAIGAILDKYAGMDSKLLYPRAFLFLFILQAVCFAAFALTRETGCKNIYRDMMGNNSEK